MRLIQRPLGLKLAIGIFVDAWVGKYEYVDPGSTLLRAGHVYANYASIFTGRDHIHPYTKMWDSIADWYQLLGWNNLSNRALASLLREASQEGWFKVSTLSLLPEDLHDQGYGFHPVSVEDQEAAAKKWVDWGWINYEEKKEDKIIASAKIGRLGLTAASATGALGTLGLLLGDL